MIEKELQRIIDGCIEHDRQSQELLYKSLFGFAMNICLRYADNRYEASEVLNEGFLKPLPISKNTIKACLLKRG